MRPERKRKHRTSQPIKHETFYSNPTGPMTNHLLNSGNEEIARTLMCLFLKNGQRK